MKTIIMIYGAGYLAVLFTWIFSDKYRAIYLSGRTDISGILIGSFFYPVALFNYIKDEFIK